MYKILLTFLLVPFMACKQAPEKIKLEFAEIVKVFLNGKERYSGEAGIIQLIP